MKKKSYKIEFEVHKQEPKSFYHTREIFMYLNDIPTEYMMCLPRQKVPPHHKIEHSDDLMMSMQRYFWSDELLASYCLAKWMQKRFQSNIKSLARQKQRVPYPHKENGIAKMDYLYQEKYTAITKINGNYILDFTQGIEALKSVLHGLNYEVWEVNKKRKPHSILNTIYYIKPKK